MINFRFFRDQINIMKYPVLFDVRKLHIAKKKKLTKNLKKLNIFFSDFANNINVTREKNSDIRYIVFTNYHHKLHCSNTHNIMAICAGIINTVVPIKSLHVFSWLPTLLWLKNANRFRGGQWPRLKNKYMQQSG